MFGGELLSPRSSRDVLFCEFCHGALLHRAARLFALVFIVAAMASTCAFVRAQESLHDPCTRPTPGSAVQEPEDQLG